MVKLVLGTLISVAIWSSLQHEWWHYGACPKSSLLQTLGIDSYGHWIGDDCSPEWQFLHPGIVVMLVLQQWAVLSPALDEVFAVAFSFVMAAP